MGKQETALDDEADHADDGDADERTGIVQSPAGLDDRVAETGAGADHHLCGHQYPPAIGKTHAQPAEKMGQRSGQEDA